MPMLEIEIEKKLEQARSQNKTAQSVLRVEVKIPSMDPLGWLEAQPASTKIYWRDRTGDFEVAGVGQVRPAMTKNAPHNKNSRYYGGLRFSNHSEPDPSWRAFGSCQFILPRFEIVQCNAETSLACNLLSTDDTSQMMEEFCQLHFNPKPIVSNIPRLLQRWDNPNRSDWNQKVQNALDAFESHDLEKIVLARKSTFEFESQLDPLQFFERLRTATPDCFHFCFQFHPTLAFIGASPERLFKQEKEKVWSEALAGTRPRGISDEEDQRLGQELLQSQKDRKEHLFVVQGIQQSLQPRCRSLEIDSEPSLVKLAGGQHLLTHLQGILNPRVTPTQLLEALHPTPAVGGYPTKRALEEIQKLEPFDRGWYAGPVGWIGSEAAEFAVGIRSGLVEGNKLSLFSGAGIVQGSTPEGEWEEIEHKISNFIKILDP